MRNLVWFLSLAAVAVVGFFVLLPIIGVILLFIAAAMLFLFAAPWLARLPWFRDRIFVQRRGAARPRAEQMDQGDVIDVEGRSLPEEKE